MTGSERLEDAMIPLDTLPARFGVSRATIARWLTADGIRTHPIPGARNNERAIRWGDIPTPNATSTRWRVPT
jgi:hypothetical protein